MTKRLYFKANVRGVKKQLQAYLVRLDLATNIPECFGPYTRTGVYDITGNSSWLYVTSPDGRPLWVQVSGRTFYRKLGRMRKRIEARRAKSMAILHGGIADVLRDQLLMDSCATRILPPITCSTRLDSQLTVNVNLTIPANLIELNFIV
jgi:hypothetical protein